MQPLTVALAALQHWAAHGAGQTPSTRNPTELDNHLRQTAWQIAGKSQGDGWPAPQGAALAWIFSQIEPRSGESALPAAFLPRASLHLSEQVIFPRPAPATLGEHADPALALGAEIAALAARDLSEVASAEALLFALQRHAWSMPSPLEAVSLYDYARMHAALAAALAKNPDDDLCLVGGDLSGVQEFIYSVPAAGAAKQLRGRSLYLQLLTDACAHVVLTEAGMPLTNLIYAGGGRFYVLLPSKFVSKIVQWRGKIGGHLLAAHHGALYLALGAVSFSAKDYSSEKWRLLSDEIDADKRRRFAALNQADFATLFEPRQPQPSQADSDEEPLDNMGKSLAELGQHLSRAMLLSAKPGPIQLFTPTNRDPDFPYYTVLDRMGLPISPREEAPDRQVAPGSYRRILQLADSATPDLQPGDLLGLRYTVTEAPIATVYDVEEYTRLGLNADVEQELRVGNVLPFNLLVKRSRGVERIGVLRMDVDDLGELFGTRLKRDSGVAALATTAALSGALSRFFEGWVGKLCRDLNEQGMAGGVVAVYSGGDDLFLVGSWHLMPGLARQIRDDFARYVLGRALERNERPPISLSAGLTLHGAGYPLYQAADDAANALDAAKSFRRIKDNHSKDAITFLGRSLGWEQFAEAAAIQAELIQLLSAGAPRGLLMVLQNLAEQARSGQRRARDGSPQPTYGPWIWQGAYQLTRMAERAQGKAGEQIESLRERILEGVAVTKGAIDRAGLAARWTQLLIRDEMNDTDDD